MKKRMLKVNPADCKTLDEWLKRSGPYDIEASLLDIAAGVPLTYHDAVYLFLRAMEKDVEVPFRVFRVYGPRGWDDLIRSVCKATAPKAVGDLVFRQFSTGRKKRDDLYRQCRETWDWAHNLRASMNNYEVDPATTLEKSIEHLQIMAASNRREYRSAVRSLDVGDRLRFDLKEDNVSPGETITYTESLESFGIGRKGIVVSVSIPERIQSLMATRRPLVFAQSVFSPDSLTDTGKEITNAHKAIVLERKLIRYVGIPSPQNALYEATWIRDQGAGYTNVRRETGIMFSTSLLKRLRGKLELRSNPGVPMRAYSRYADFFHNYYVNCNKAFCKKFINVVTRISETTG